MSADGFVVLTLAFHKEGCQWVAECLELGTSGFAGTLEQAHAELVELVELDLSTLEDIGERERFFAEHGIELHSSAPTEVTTTLRLQEDGLYIHPHRFPVGEAA